MGSGAGHLGEGASPAQPLAGAALQVPPRPFCHRCPRSLEAVPSLAGRAEAPQHPSCAPHPLFTSTLTTLGYGTATVPARPRPPPAPTRAEPKRGAGGAGAEPIIPSPTAPLSTGTQQQLSPAVPGSIGAEPSQQDHRRCPRPRPQAPRGRAGAFWGAGSLCRPPPACRS